MNFNYKNPISPITSLGVISVPRTEVYGTNFSVLSTGGFMEVYSVNDLYYTIPSGSTGLIEYTGNTIPIQFQKGTGSVFSPDVLTLNSDNISSGRRRIGMLVYVIDQDQIYQYQIPNFENLWTGATTATGPGGPTVVISDFGTTIKSNSPEGIAFISAWTANTIEGISGETSSTAVWKKLVTGGGGGVSGDYLPLSGGTVTGDTIFTSGLTANTFSASTYLGLPQDVFVTGGTYSAGTATFTNNTGGTFDVIGFVSADTYTTGFTFDIANYDLTIKRNDGIDLTTNLSILASDVTITGGTYDSNTGTATFTNNTGGTFNVTGFLTGFTDIYVTGGTFSKSAETLTLLRNDNNSIPITGFTDVFVTGGTYANGTLFLTNNSGSTFSVAGFSTATGSTSNYYGSFSDTTNQSVSGANIATVWTYDTTELSNGIYIVDGSKITVSNDGIYEIGYSAQIQKTQGVGANVTIWAKINGNNVDRSSSTITLENNSVYSLPFVSYIFDLYAGDQVEFYFSSPSDHVQITTLSGLTTPTRPVSPSVIIGAKAIGNAVLNTSGDSFVTGFSLTNDTLTLSQNRVGLYSGFSVNLPYLNTSGGTITGNLSVSGSVSATTYYGNGSNLTGISRGGGGGAGGQLYYFNISNTQTPYYEFSTTATTAAEQTISATASSNATVLIGGFMTPSTLPNITNFPAGILSFYLHSYDGGTNHSFDIYCELYKRTTGGTETLLFTSDAAAVVGNVVSMVISDGYFSGATLNSSDRLVVKVYGTNLTNQTRTIYLVSEGSSHYSFAFTTIPTFTDTYVTGFTYSDNTLTIKQNNNQVDLTATINTFTGLTANTISATTYQNLPTDIRVTGGTYSNGTVTFTNNTGGTFNVSGFYTGATDVFVTGATYNNANQFTFTNNTGGTFNVSFNQVTGLTATTLSATTISGGTFFGNGSNLTGISAASGIFGISNSAGTYTFYSTLTLAMAAAVSGDAIEMFSDVTETGAVTITLKPDVVINGNGYTYILNNTGSTNAFQITSSGNYTIRNLILTRTGSTITTSYQNLCVYVNTNSVTCNLEGCILRGQKSCFSTQSLITNFVLIGGSYYSGAIAVLAYGPVSSANYAYVDNIYCESTATDGSSAINLTYAEGNRLSARQLAASGGGSGIVTNTANVRNSYGYSFSSYGISTSVGELRLSVGESNSSRGISGSGSIYNCVGKSNTDIGLFNQGVTYNSVGISNTSVGFYPYITAPAYNCVGISTSSWGIVGYNNNIFNCHSTSTSNVGLSMGGGYTTTRFIDCSFTSNWNSANGHAVAISNSVMQFHGCTFVVTNTSANCINNSAAPSPITVRYTKSTFINSTTPVSATITQGVTNTADNQGNLIIN